MNKKGKSKGRNKKGNLEVKEYGGKIEER